MSMQKAAVSGRHAAEAACVAPQMAMCSVAFLLSTLVAKASVATLLGFMVFIIGWIMQTVTYSHTHFKALHRSCPLRMHAS